jgi:isoleucyl-tRNA synthetase
VRQRATGMVLIVAESRLSQLPTIKTKVETSTKVKGDMTNSGAPKDKSAHKYKGAVKKGENDKSPPPVDTTSYEVIGQYKGSDLVGKKYKPLFDYFSALSNVAFKVVADDYVTDDSGTGVVHCAPAFGEDDYRVCLLNNIIQKGPNLPNPVDSDGHFTEEVTDFKGRYVKEVDKDIISAIKVYSVVTDQQNVGRPLKHMSVHALSLLAWFLKVEPL